MALGLNITLLNLAYVLNPMICGLIYDKVYHFNPYYAYPS